MEGHSHAGHRDRIKERVRKEHLDSFADHELLELLLFYVVRQGDTNPTGHALLDRFGSITGILNASTAELCQVTGVGEQSAILLRTIAQMVKRYTMDQSIDGRKSLETIQQMHSYLAAQFIGESREVVYLLLLDRKLHVLACHLVGQGTVDFCHLNMRMVIEQVLQYQASCIVIAHNHPTGVACPSGDDLKTTRVLEHTLGTLQLSLYDHLIVSPSGAYSFRQHNDLLEKGFI